MAGTSFKRVERQHQADGEEAERREAVEARELKGYGGHTMYGAEASTVKPALLHNQTVREILGYIVLNSRAEGWIVAGPPGCLGFTPYCGLWFLIETVPSTPSYGLLLRRIRENL